MSFSQSLDVGQATTNSEESKERREGEATTEARQEGDTQAREAGRLRHHFVVQQQRDSWT